MLVRSYGGRARCLCQIHVSLVARPRAPLHNQPLQTDVLSKICASRPDTALHPGKATPRQGRTCVETSEQSRHRRTSSPRNAPPTSWAATDQPEYAARQACPHH